MTIVLVVVLVLDKAECDHADSENGTGKWEPLSPAAIPGPRLRRPIAARASADARAVRHFIGRGAAQRHETF
ncbi:MAG: hypothetical protein L0387_14825 [Acidobacteria bacterium]|nr:hypothetical protein [Acidobacteriota bacterium]